MLIDPAPEKPVSNDLFRLMTQFAFKINTLPLYHKFLGHSEPGHLYIHPHTKKKKKVQSRRD